MYVGKRKGSYDSQAQITGLQAVCFVLKRIIILSIAARPYLPLEYTRDFTRVSASVASRFAKSASPLRGDFE